MSDRAKPELVGTVDGSDSEDIVGGLDDPVSGSGEEEGGSSEEGGSLMEECGPAGGSGPEEGGGPVGGGGTIVRKSLDFRDFARCIPLFSDISWKQTAP